MFPIIGKIHLTIGTGWPKEKAHVIILVENNTIQISCILVTRPNLRRPRKSVQLVGVVVDAMVDTTVDAVADAKVNTRIGATIRQMGIEMIMEMVFERGTMLGCAIAVVMSVNGMTPIIMNFMPLGSVILEILPCLLTMIIGNCKGILVVSQLEVETLREAEWALKTNSLLDLSGVISRH